MRAWVWFVLAGCGRIGFDSTSSPLPPPDDAVTAFPGAHADPSLLPLATGQTEGATAPGAAIGANTNYLDPISGVRVWKLTDASFPLPNVGARTDQGVAGAQVSAAWEDDHHTIAVELDLGSGQRRRHLIDLQRGIGVAGDTPLVVQGSEDAMLFSADPTDPRVLFATDASNRLHRIDTATNTVMDAGPFPVDDVKLLPTTSAAGRVIVAQRIPDGLLAINTITGPLPPLETGDNQAPVVDHDGQFAIQMVSGPTQLWRLGEPASSGWITPSGDFQVSAGVTGGFVAVDVDSGPPMEIYFSDPRTRTHDRIGVFPGYDAVQLASQWIQTDVPVDQQWVLWSTFENDFTGGGPLDDAIGFFQLDHEFRFLTHHYGPDRPVFEQQPRASLSPDGRIAVFTSTMGTGRLDVYAVEVPLSR